MKNIAVGGVPEHFNYPWHVALAAASAERFRWQDYPGGSGAMGAALDSGELDVAMLLTEAAVAGIAKGGRYRILSWYTRSPLIWGIHAPGAAADLGSVADVRGARYAISRYGSGSHLMCFAHAQSMSWPVGDLRFVVVGDLEGAIEAFDERRADVFLWEKFMTQPLVESGRFKRLGEYTAPWPAFVVCVSEAALAAHRDEIVAILGRVLHEAQSVASDEASASSIAQRYGLQPSAVASWLGTTTWASEVAVDAPAVEELLDVLVTLEIAPPGQSAARFIAAA